MTDLGLDPDVISIIISQHIEQVTCIECCKYYIAPTTAACGHTLCHGCWIGRRSCPVCDSPLVRKTLRQNIPMQTLTDHIHVLGDAFENAFNIKLDELILDVTENIIEKDPTKHVKDWLASSQNHFSGPVLYSQQSTEDTPALVDVSANKIQIHADKKLEVTKMTIQKINSPTNVIRAPIRQDDWDRIETLPDTGENVPKNKGTLVTEDVEPFFIDSNEYSTENPRRSTRKNVKNDSTPQTLVTSEDKHSSKNLSTETDKKSTKSKHDWSNVKKMRKEFGKLSKIKRNKLNISIEMCKKNKNSSTKPQTPDIVSIKPCYTIDDNTPDIMKDQVLTKETPEKASIPLDQKGTLIKMNHIESESSDKSSAIGNIHKHLQNKEDNEEQPKKNNENLLDRINSTSEKIEDDILTRNQSKTGSDNLAKNNDSNVISFIKRGILHQKTNEENSVRVVQNQICSDTGNVNTDDIEISIKMGNTITNIFIKKKENDVQLKVHTDREIQTSLDTCGPPQKHDASCSPIKENNIQNLDGSLRLRKASKTTPVIPATKITPVNKETQSTKLTTVSKSTCIKKNTDSADTATANFEISKSVEKELSDLMKCVETDDGRNKGTKRAFAKSNKSLTPVSLKRTNETVKAIDTEDDIENLNDLDIFGSGSVKEANVHLLKDSNHAPSEIFIPTLKSKKSQKVADKRERDENDAPEMPNSKKQKPNFDTIPELPTEESLQENETEVANNSEAYDVIMSQVFANIDADIKNQNTKQTHDNIKSPTRPTRKNYDEEKKMPVTQTIFKYTQKPDADLDLKEVINQKHSENVFSLLEKDSESTEILKNNNNQQHVPQSTQDHIKNLLTPGMCRDLAASLRDEQSQVNDVEMVDLELATPVQDQDDSDKSVVEETPQKSKSYSKNRQKPDQSNITVHNIDKELPKLTSNKEKKVADLSNKSMSHSQFSKSIINISDSKENNKNETLLEIPKRSTLETPLTINKFVDLIKHNSTPLARKSLNFECENLDDSEQTLCPTTTQAKQISQNTQEKEFLKNAFEDTPKSPINRPLSLKNVKSREYKKGCLAGSCLTSTQLERVKILCTQRGWQYVDKYTKDLTHLVVGVDEENKSQRSVKYMCALAASKWIVSYSWVEKCLQMKDVVDEELYEALDAGGEPGPKRSRVGTRKLFDGFTFYCMPPFSILDLDTLKYILESAGGRVVNDQKDVKLTENSPPALLLAEPENTEEDHFIYLALELSVVPVNYEWVLNCLGNYTISSLHELLLCPSAALPPCTSEWPAALLESDD